MSERALRTTNVAAGALLIGGTLVVLLPGRALTILQVVLVAVAAAAALWVLARSVPQTGWISPFRWMSPFGEAAPTLRGHRSHALGFLRDRLGDRRQPIEGGPPLPPAVLRRLRGLIAAELDLDLRDERSLTSARGRLSPLALAVLSTQPLQRATWLQTVHADERAAADTVHRVLDELERLSRPGEIT